MVNIDSEKKYQLPHNPKLFETVVLTKSNSASIVPTEIYSLSHSIMGKKQPLLFDIAGSAEIEFHGQEKGWVVNLV